MMEVKVLNLAAEIGLARQENVNLTKQIADLNDKVCFLERYARDNDVHIQGVPYEKNVILINTLCKI